MKKAMIAATMKKAIPAEAIAGAPAVPVLH